MRSSILIFVETSDDWNNRVTKDAAAVTEKKRMFEEGIENGSIKKPKKGQEMDFTTGITCGEDPGPNGDFRSWKQIVPRFEFDASVRIKATQEQCSL
jgi:hypothetical protein